MGEQLDGTCIAQNAQPDHPLAGSPLADYAVGGREVSSVSPGSSG